MSKREWDRHEFGVDWGAMAGKLGLDFIPLIQKHQYCSYYNVGNGAFYHRKERIKMLWPEYQWTRWGERRLQGLCNYRSSIWMGPASSGKSVDAAIFGLEYWLQAPHETAVIVCSTTMKMLRKRIWSEIVRFHQMLPKNLGPVGELMDSVTTIRWQQGDDRHAIFGIAVEEGNIEEVIMNLVGIKAKRMFLEIDEGQGIREAILRARGNMSKNPRFDFLMMGNPESMQTPLLREGTPLAGWDSVVRAVTPEWECNGGPVPGNGLCQFFDGRESPADDSPEERKRLPFLINKDQIADHLRSVGGNLNDPTYWSQCVGWPPPLGIESTLLDDAIMATFHCRDKATWTEGYTECAALDPAFNGGDKAILQFGKRGRSSGLGYDQDTRTWSTSVGSTAWIIEFGDWMQVPINAESSTPIHYQIMEYVRNECQKRGIPPHEVAIAAAGEGGGLVSICQKEWGAVNAIEEGGAPSERMVANQFNSDGSPKTAKEYYDTRASELSFGLREFAMANGIRGMSNEMTFQATSLRTFYRNSKWATEPKVGSKGRTDEKGRPVRGYKQRMGHSCDHFDSGKILVEHCRMQGAEPLVAGDAVAQQEQEYAAQQGPDEFSSENYLQTPSFSEY